jgi:Protein of unknown function (DUF3574)
MGGLQVYVWRRSDQLTSRASREPPPPVVPSHRFRAHPLITLRFFLRSFVACILLLAGAAGVEAQEPTPSCHGTQQLSEVAELLFGRFVDNHLGVSESDWAGFVAREITPRFPHGLTIIDAVEQRRDPDSEKIIREPSKMVEIVMPGDSDDEARLDAIVLAYKQAFHQKAVHLIVRHNCVAF